jgi:hypothetical protein
VGHLRQHGFAVKEVGQDDLRPIRARYGVPRAAESCHVAVVSNYVVEGHVPADVIKRMLREKPRIVGIGVPGMPVGSPGMESPGATPQRYDVLSFDSSGATKVYERR